jgi:phage-related protein
MKIEPFEHKAQRPLRENPMYDSTFNINRNLILPIDGMEVRRFMISWKDTDHDSEKSRDFWHRRIFSLLFFFHQSHPIYFTAIFTDLIVKRWGKKRDPSYETEKKVVEKCHVRIELVKEFGNTLRRPYADFLRDGIYELRVSYKRIQYRILYFFHGKNVVIISHGLTKEQKVPEKEVNKAIERKIKLEKDPKKHIFKEIANV